MKTSPCIFTPTNQARDLFCRVNLRDFRKYGAKVGLRILSRLKWRNVIASMLESRYGQKSGWNDISPINSQAEDGKDFR